MSGDDEEFEELRWQVAQSSYQLSQLEVALRTLKVRVTILFVFAGVLAFVLVASAIWHVSREYRSYGEDYEIIVGAASIFGFFFLYEAGSSAVNAYWRLLRGRQLCKQQERAIREAEAVLTRDRAYGA